MSNREVMQLALEALEHSLPFHETVERLEAHNKSITALRAALSEQCPHGVTDGCKECYVAEQEPVAWMDRDGDVYPMPENKNWAPPHTMLYTAPPQRKPLTDEEIWEALSGIDCTRPLLIARAIEAHHGIGEKK